MPEDTPSHRAAAPVPTQAKTYFTDQDPGHVDAERDPHLAPKEGAKAEPAPRRGRKDA